MSYKNDNTDMIGTKISWTSLFGPRCGKTCLQGFQQSETQTSLLSYRDYLENWNDICGKFKNDTFQKANDKGTDQSAQMRRLVSAFVVSNPQRQVFLSQGPLKV